MSAVLILWLTPWYIYIYIYIYVIMKTMCLLCYHHNGFVQLMHLGKWCTETIHHVPNQVHELPQSHCGDNQKGTLFSWLDINITPIFMRFEHNIYIYYHENICFPNYHHSGFVTTDELRHMLPKSMGCHRITVVITKSAHCLFSWFMVCIGVSTPLKITH